MVERIINWRQLLRPRGRRRHGTEGGRRPWGWEPVSPARALKAPTAVWASAGAGYTTPPPALQCYILCQCQVSTSTSRLPLAHLSSLYSLSCARFSLESRWWPSGAHDTSPVSNH